MFIAAIFVVNFTFYHSAEARNDPFAYLRDWGHTQCTLLQRAPLKPPAKLQLAPIALSEEGLQPNYVTQYAYAPDFGFLLPNHWAAMSLTQRSQFNHNMSALVKNQFGLTQKAPSSMQCESQIRIRLIQSTETKTQNGYEAISLVTIQSQKTIVPIAYYFTQDETQSWKLNDILIQNTSLTQLYTHRLERIIRISGVTKLQSILQDWLNQF